jgi:hypothetical protein
MALRLDAATKQWRMSDWYNIRRLYEEAKKTIDRLRGENGTLQQEVERLRKENGKLQKEKAGLEQQLQEMAMKKQAKKQWFKKNYSLSNQEKQRRSGALKRSTGRIPKEEKLSQVDREEHVYPEGILPKDCRLSHTRIVTHIRDGRMEVVLYRVYRETWGNGMGKVPDAMPGGEYGLEVAVTLAFLVYVIEVSIKQAQDILLFFTGITLSDAQANALLDQLSALWNPELERLITLVTLAMLVHIDETGWKTGKERNYAWIFRTLSHTVFLFGQDRSEETLEKVLPREFQGIAVSDFFSTYEKYFTRQQKCWAHLLRTLIKLMLLHPKKKEYKRFFEALYALFLEAKVVQKEETLSQEERALQVAAFQDRIRLLTQGCERRMTKATPSDVREFRNLQRRLLKYQGSLFTFVLHPEVDPTNNRAEQGLRKTAKARNNYQTSKTKKGAERRSILTSVLTSLQQSLPAFSLSTVIEEVTRWRQEGTSLFQMQLQECLARASPG